MIRNIQGRSIFFLLMRLKIMYKLLLLHHCLKNSRGHKITTIGAGVPEFDSINVRFMRNIVAKDLFLSSNDMLEDTGVVSYFSQKKNATTTPAQATEIRKNDSKTKSLC
jgi:hypothetical protein